MWCVNVDEIAKYFYINSTEVNKKAREWSQTHNNATYFAYESNFRFNALKYKCQTTHNNVYRSL